MIHQFCTYLSTQHDFTADEWQQIDAAFLPKTYARGDFFMRAGQIDRYLWFMESGILRIYDEPADAPERTFYFMSAGQLVADPESFSEQTPSPANLQALTTCQTRAVSYDSFQRLATDVPAWGSTIQRITEKALMEKVRKRSRLLYENARSRYQRLLLEQPDVARQVPLGLIASYLGITLSSLSRLRKQLAVDHV